MRQQRLSRPRRTPWSKADDAQLVAAYHYASQTIDGTLPLRELASWAHRIVGHEGHPIAQELVELDDAYDAYDGWGGQPDDAMQVVTNLWT